MILGHLRRCSRSRREVKVTDKRTGHRSVLRGKVSCREKTTKMSEAMGTQLGCMCNMCQDEGHFAR